MSAKKIQNRAQRVAIRRFADLFSEAAEALIDQHDEASAVLASAACELSGYEDECEHEDGVDLARFIVAGIGSVVS